MTDKPNHTYDEDPELHMGEHFHTRHASKYVSVYVFILLLLAAMAGTYTWQHHKVKLETSRVKTLQTQLITAQQSYEAVRAATPKFVH